MITDIYPNGVHLCKEGKMENKEKAISLAAKLLNISESQVSDYSHTIDGVEALYISIPVKGGDSLIVSYSGEVLYANSSIDYDTHLKEFLKGTRTPLDVFKQ